MHQGRNFYLLHSAEPRELERRVTEGSHRLLRNSSPEAGRNRGEREAIIARTPETRAKARAERSARFFIPKEGVLRGRRARGRDAVEEGGTPNAARLLPS